jgi:hypothetical protein
MMNSLKKYFYILSLAALLAVPVQVYGQEVSISFDSTIPSEVRQGEEVVIPILLENSSNTEINTIKMSVLVPNDIFLLDNFWFENSLVSLWIEDPSIVEKGDVSVLTFTGLIPGGTDASGHLVSIILRALEDDGKATIKITDASTYLHTGKAEKINLDGREVDISLLPSLDSTIPQRDFVIQDKEPPNDFFPIVARNTQIFNGDYFLMFHTIDLQTGIDRFEILESTLFYTEEELADSRNLYWREVQNPARLQDQGLDSYLYVRAYDNAGNHRTVVIPPTSFSGSVSFWDILKESLRSIVLVLVLGGVTLVGVRRRRKNNEKFSE